MCRLLAVTAAAPVDTAPHLRAFAEIARNSREYQGHGWGVAWHDGDTWQAFHSVTPIWEDDVTRFGSARVFVAHARSAFRDEGIAVENNMPFIEPPFAFVFNGELRGVRIAEQGRIGAEKLFRFLVRHGAGAGDEGMRTAVRLVGQRTRYIRAMNAVLGVAQASSRRAPQPDDVAQASSRRAPHGCFVICSIFNEDEVYFTLHARRGREVSVVCSEPYGDAVDWTPLPNGTIEVIPWCS
jgi:predicted glutamine amidotransferase